MHDSIYEPAEDSILLAKVVEKYAFGTVLDVGTGSGIQAFTALKNKRVSSVTAVDINPAVIEELCFQKRKQRVAKLTIIQSDLFEKVRGKFDTIIFNPPYLPQDEGIHNLALYGGKNGWEISERFFESVVSHLNRGGIVLFLFSTLTNKVKIDQILRDRLLGWELVGSTKISFEELYVYKITRSSLLVELEALGIRSISFHAKGKRGRVYRGFKGTRKVAIKVEQLGSASMASSVREAQILSKVNLKKIGARLLVKGEGFLVLEFIEGVLFEEWITTHSVEEIVGVVMDLLKQCFVLDTLGITKEEMHHPFKHIIISNTVSSVGVVKYVPVLIDFERAHADLRPQNVTQFVDYLCRLRERFVRKGLVVDKDILRGLVASYKKTYARREFDLVLKVIKDFG